MYSGNWCMEGMLCSVQEIQQQASLTQISTKLGLSGRETKSATLVSETCHMPTEIGAMEENKAKKGDREWQWWCLVCSVK